MRGLLDLFHCPCSNLLVLMVYVCLLIQKLPSNTTTSTAIKAVYTGAAIYACMHGGTGMYNNKRTSLEQPKNTT